jgi:hypothetical protein
LKQAESDPDFSGADIQPANRRLLGAVLASAGFVSFGLGLNAQALEYGRRSSAIAREEGDLRMLSWVQSWSASLSSAMGDLEQANP